MSQIEVDKIIPQSGTSTQLGESGDTITIPAGATITNNGTANGFGSADTEKVKVSANDTTAGFLNGKLVAGTNISLTEGSDGGNETLTAALTGTIATAQIANDAITLDKMAPGTDGNIISYDASGNPVAVATGSAGQVLTSAGAGAVPSFQTAAGGTNTPNFEAYLSSDQSYSSGYTKVQFNAERFDTANAYDSSSNYRFTVPSGQGGKYFIGAQVLGNSSNENGLSYNFTAIYKNGSIFSNTSQDYRGSRIHNAAVVNSGIYDLSAGDYLEVYVLLSGNGTISLDADNGNVTNQTRFYGFKLL